MNTNIEKRVHELYWESDTNCARTTLICLGESFDTKIEEQTYNAAIGLHGAGGFRAQCGLVEGALMFIGLYFSTIKECPKTRSLRFVIVTLIAFATKQFGSLTCYDLRPNGFNADDPPHLCEGLTVEAIEFVSKFIEEAQI